MWRGGGFVKNITRDSFKILLSLYAKNHQDMQKIYKLSNSFGGGNLIQNSPGTPAKINELFNKQNIYNTYKMMQKWVGEDGHFIQNGLVTHTRILSPIGEVS